MAWRMSSWALEADAFYRSSKIDSAHYYVAGVMETCLEFSVGEGSTAQFRDLSEVTKPLREGVKVSSPWLLSLLATLPVTQESLKPSSAPVEKPPPWALSGEGCGPTSCRHLLVSGLAILPTTVRLHTAAVHKQRCLQSAQLIRGRAGRSLLRYKDRYPACERPGPFVDQRCRACVCSSQWLLLPVLCLRRGLGCPEKGRPLYPGTASL